MGGLQTCCMDSITIQIDGTLVFSNDIKSWPRHGDGLKAGVLECMYFYNMSNFTITSSNGPMGGLINGQGDEWWGFPGAGYLEHTENRPRILNIASSSHVLIENIAIVQPPYWTVWANSITDMEIRYSSIDARRLDKHHTSHGGVEKTAFNTDGFDITGQNIWIHDCTVWNQDDSFCIKDGTRDVVVERVSSSGLGLTIGSIGGSHVKNVTFRDIHMPHTVKGVYMKFRGNGLVEDVLYEDIVMDAPEQFAVWIGPAQQSDSDYPCAAHPCSL